MCTHRRSTPSRWVALHACRSRRTVAPLHSCQDAYMGSSFCALLVLSTLGVMYVETHEQWVARSAGCARTGDQRQCDLASMSRRMLVLSTLGVMYVETHEQWVARPAGCARTGDQHHQDGRACIHVKAHTWGARLCAALLILCSLCCSHVKAHVSSTLGDLNARTIQASGMGGACIHVKVHGSCVHCPKMYLAGRHEK